MIMGEERDVDSQELLQYSERTDRPDFGLKIIVPKMAMPACVICAKEMSLSRCICEK